LKESGKDGLTPRENVSTMQVSGREHEETKGKDQVMKVCEKCGEEIYTKDGENMCQQCEEGIKKAKRDKARLSRKAREEALRSCGLVKVRGALGGTFWE
jgi:uncharacterized Zn finger protein (UPF0148 family)